MKARIIATGEIWTFSQIDEITFKSAINGHLYCAEELEFLEPSVFSPDYWTRLEHTYAGMVMQGILSRSGYEIFEDLKMENWCIKIARSLVEKIKEEKK